AGAGPRHVPGAVGGAGDGMNAARAAIRARLAGAQRSARLPAPPAAEPFDTPPRSRADCLARFRSELEALGVACHVEASAAAVRERVRGLTQGKRVLGWDPDALPYAAASAVPGLMQASRPYREQAQAEVG